MERKGFHVPCNTDLDCFSRCGSTIQLKPTHALTTLAVNQSASFVPGHPVTGMHYVCTHNVQLYSQAGFSKKAYEDQVAANVQLKAGGEPHPKIWLPDSNNEDFYMLDMPGIASRISSTPTPSILARSHAFPNTFQVTISTTSSLARACAPTRTTTTCTRGATRSKPRGLRWRSWAAQRKPTFIATTCAAF